MSRTPVKIKRLSDLRSAVVRSGNGQQFPHQTYMRLCCLEMERFRREQERAAAMVRAGKCLDRCRAIEEEVKQLLETIGQSRRDDVRAQLHTPDDNVVIEPLPSPPQRGQKMTFSY